MFAGRTYCGVVGVDAADVLEVRPGGWGASPHLAASLASLEAEVHHSEKWLPLTCRCYCG